MQGTGNDFLLVESDDQDRDWGRLASAMCHRYFGVGADGLMVVMPSQHGDVRMRLFNADGSEAEVSGNGVRCLVKYAVERGLARARDGRLRIEVARDVLEASFREGERGVESVRLSMGRPRFAPQEIPVLAEVEPPLLDLPLDVEGLRIAVSCVSMGNPHAVHFQSAPVEDWPLDRLGPLVERHAVFPARVNFGVARVRDRGTMDLRVWERGVGETLACGSGSCAAVVTAQLKGLVGDRVEVRQPGGILLVEWDGKGEVYLSGPAAFVFEGEWPDERQA
jgi:diaminopimelate epimerase